VPFKKPITGEMPLAFEMMLTRPADYFYSKIKSCSDDAKPAGTFHITICQSDANLLMGGKIEFMSFFCRKLWRID
jgi:hypothetical protein